MRRLFSRNLNNINTAVWTLVYGILLLTSNTHVRISEPPFRWILIFSLFAVAFLLLFSIFNDNPRFKSWVLVIAGTLWAVIGTLYLLTPVANHEWAICFMVVIFIWNSIYRGGRYE